MNDDSKRDLLTLGVAWERDGKGIDPNSVYLRAQPVAWLEGPHGTLRRNPLWKLDPMPPQTVAWSIPLYTTSLVVPQPLTELPPLPEPHATVDIWGHDCPHYTREQMRAYARAVEAEMLKRMGVQR